MRFAALRPAKIRSLAIPVGLVVLALLWGAAAAATDPAPAASGKIGAGELAGRVEGGDAPVILDVRTPKEFRRGHIPGAVNIPHDQLAERLDEVPAQPDEEVVVHCHSGKRAELAEAVLRDAGYTQVRDLEGHWKGWQASGLPKE